MLKMLAKTSIQGAPRKPCFFFTSDLKRWAAKKEGVPVGTPSLNSGPSDDGTGYFSVDAGTEVNVKRRSIHHQSRNRLDASCFCFFRLRFIRAESWKSYVSIVDLHLV